MDIARETARAYQAFARGDHRAAAERAQRVLGLAPHDPAALTLIGRIALASDEPDVARQLFDTVLARHSHTAAVWLDLALALRNLARHDDARAAVERAIALDAKQPAAWIRLGEIERMLNRRGAAGHAFRRALALAPDSVAACRGLCQVEDIAAESELVRRMESLTKSTKLSPRESAELHYTLAQVYRREGRSTDFIRHVFAANAKQRAICPDGRAEYDAIFDRLDSIFSADALARAARAEPVTPVPIFVLGMPRSGTTLVEQILAAHPDVAAAGELDYVRGPMRREMERLTGQPFPKGFAEISAAAMTGLARAFAHRLALVGHGARYVTDKTPGNYHVLGLLRLLFPHGRIVHVVRDPMDTCFSVLQYPFDDRSPHTCDMALLAHSYARYVRLMKRWQALLGDAFITVQYERLVEAPAAEARRVFEHCGLTWDDAYLDFHRANNAVRTFSTTQVRRPIYTSSVGAWRDYAEVLAPLREALERELANDSQAILQMHAGRRLT